MSQTTAPMRVKETFNIFKDGRQHNPAPQQFQLAALKTLFSTGETKERIRLGEAIGYWGHRIREMTGKITPTEFEVIQIDGKPVVINVEPVVRTLSVDIDDNGNVTHEQEFMDTELGRKAFKLHQQGHGGFSWAMSGRDGRGAGASVATSFAGFDYVAQPNFIPLHRQGMLLSSMQSGEDALLSSLKDSASSDDANKLVNMLNSSPEDDAVALSDLLVSSLVKQEQNRQANLSAALDKLPFILSEDHKAALVRQAADDMPAIVQLLSSMQNTDLSQFPHDFKKKVSAKAQDSKADDLVKMTQGYNFR